MGGIIKKILRIPFSIFRRYQNTQFRKRFGKIGVGTIVKKNSQLVPENMYLDDYVLIQNHVNFISYRGKLIVKKYSVISAECIIVPGTHKLKVGVPFYLTAMQHIADEDNDIVVEEDCWIGAGCILLTGVKIGRGSVIGAGSVVTKDIPPYAIAVGCPAKIIAVKFSKEDIILHEKALYSEKERFSEAQLNILFEKYYAHCRVNGDSIINDQDKEIIKDFLSSVCNKH